MAGKAKKRVATKGKGKAARTKAKAKPSLAAKAQTRAKGKAKPKPKKASPAPKKPVMKAKASAKPVAKAKAKPAAAPKKPGAGLQVEILAMARHVYGDLTDSQLLALDPNDIDEMDPATFYEMVAEKYGVSADPGDQNFGGFGGPISKLIAFVARQWDGRTNKDAPMPPKEWLDEFVHPATERVPHQAEPQDEPLLD